MIDESAHKVFDYGMKDWHDFRTHKCSHCSRQLDIYYCESRLYLVRCKHCKIVSLVEAGNPNEAAEKVSHRAAPENKPLTLEELPCFEPIYVVPLGSSVGEWSAHWCIYQIDNATAKSDTHKGRMWFLYNTDYSKSWLAYRRPPEEGEKE